MTINTSKQAIAKALEQTHNTPGTCQLVTRTWFNAPSAGDQDKDGDADAIDGWLSEPVSARRYDRTPPPGKPVAFRNAGRNGFGHRAISLPNGKFRSTDFDTATQRYKAGVVGTANSLAAIERSMGLVYLGWSLTIDGLPIPPDPTTPAIVRPKTVRRSIGHASLQYSDTDRQQTHDLEKIFALGLDTLTGTEAGASKRSINDTEVPRCAEKYGYFISIVPRYDSWVAIKKENAVAGTFKKGSNLVINRSSEWDPKPSGTWSDRGIVWGQIKDKDVGIITTGAIHLLTAKNAGVKIKKATDEDFYQKAKAFYKTHGPGEKLAFLNADFNLGDKYHDLYGDAPFTSCWDELRVYPGTHGSRTIDAIGSGDNDGRVSCVSARVRDDSNFFLHMDHKLVVARYDIRVL